MVTLTITTQHTQQMCPDVACLSVYSENALKTGPERRHWGPVSMQEEVVILEPLRQHIMRDHSPSTFPDLEEYQQIPLRV